MHFSLNDLEIKIHLGVPDEERKNLQTIRIDVSWNIDTTASSKTDSIEDTVDYYQVEQLVRTFSQKKSWNLLEKLHADLTMLLKLNFPLLQNLVVTITKFPFENGSVRVY